MVAGQGLVRLSHGWSQAKSWLERPELVALAIWFHDVIYNGVNKADEDQSAALFEDFAKSVGQNLIVSVSAGMFVCELTRCHAYWAS